MCIPDSKFVSFGLELHVAMVLCAPYRQPNHTRHQGQLCTQSAGIRVWMCLCLWGSVAQVSAYSFFHYFLQLIIFKMPAKGLSLFFYVLNSHVFSNWHCFIFNGNHILAVNRLCAYSRKHGTCTNTTHCMFCPCCSSWLYFFKICVSF